MALTNKFGNYIDELGEYHPGFRFASSGLNSYAPLGLALASKSFLQLNSIVPESVNFTLCWRGTSTTHFLSARRRQYVHPQFTDSGSSHKFGVTAVSRAEMPRRAAGVLPEFALRS